MNHTAARAYYASLTGATRTTPCTGCGKDAVAFTSLCRGCWRRIRPALCELCGEPTHEPLARYCGACHGGGNYPRREA